MKSIREHYAYCKYCKQDLSIQHGGRDEHTYTAKQFKSAKSTTYQALQNYDHPMNISAKFGSNLFCGFRKKDENVKFP
jgi:hypothetical protein